MQLILKATAIFLILFTFTACGDKKAESATAGDQSPQQQPSAAPQASQELVPQAFFTGSGTSPDWKMNILANVNGSFEVKIEKAGEPARSFTAMKEALYIDSKVNTASGEVKLSGEGEGGKKLSVSLITGTCKEATGKEHTHSCKVILDKEKLSGCGDYAE